LLDGRAAAVFHESRISHQVARFDKMLWPQVMDERSIDDEAERYEEAKVAA
jgi:hypothetical protein